MNNKYFEKLIELCDNRQNIDDIPVSALVVYNNQIIGVGINDKEKTLDITGHAELNAIKEAAKFLNSWKLSECDLYVTLEPCNMCVEAIKQSRIKNVYYLINKYDYKKGFNKTNFENCNATEIENLKKSYQQKLSEFFKLNCNR